MFWRRRVVEPEERAEAEPPLPVRIYSPDGITDAYSDGGPDRLSDRINRGERVRIAATSQPAPDGWRELEPRDALLLVPPPYDADRRRYQHRLRRPLVAQVGPYRVRATAHLVAGIRLDPHIVRTGRTFLPVTEAFVTSSLDPALAEQHPALLINVGSTDHPLRLDVTE